MTKPHAGRLKKDRPTVEEVLPLARALYATDEGSVGCCLHVVLDDGNTEDGFVDHAITRAIENGHEPCRVLAEKLRQMSRTQRAKVARMIYEPPTKAPPQ